MLVASDILLSTCLQIKEQLNADLVVVKDAYGDGRHVRFVSSLHLHLSH